MEDQLLIELHDEHFGPREDPLQCFDVLLNGEVICQGEVPVRLVPRFRIAVSSKGLDARGIRERHLALTKRRDVQTKKLKAIEREVTLLQAECTHPNGEKYQFKDAAQRIHNCLLCHDCGLDYRDD